MTTNNLTKDEAYQIQTDILTGKLTTEQILDFLVKMGNKKLLQEELMGFWEASKDQQIHLPTDQKCLDIVGTGGDSLDTFNISTIASIVCASVGVPVAKHGNRSASGKCGSADILEEMGYPLDLMPLQSADLLEKTGFAFLFAPIYNPAFRYVKDARKQYANLYGKPAYFNLLGPMLNPADAPFLLFGISKVISDSIDDCFDLISKHLRYQNTQNSWLVQSLEGMDEISIDQKTLIIKPLVDGDINANNDIGRIPLLRDGLNKIQPHHPYQSLLLDPSKYDLRHDLANITTSGVEQNKEIFQNILNNTATESQKSAIILNAGAGLLIAKRVKTYRQGIELARQTIESGMLQSKWTQILEIVSEMKKTN